MKTIISLDDMLRSIHNAILQTQQLTEQQHLRNLQSYFSEDEKKRGTYIPKTYRIRLPDGEPGPSKQSEGDGSGENGSEGDGGADNTNGSESDGEQKPPSDGAGEGKKGGATELDIPIVALLPHSSIKIKDFRMNLKVGVVGYYKEKAGFAIEGDKEVHAGPLFVDVGAGSVRSERKTSVDNLADVTVTFENTDPPEWFLRLGDQVIKSIL